MFLFFYQIQMAIFLWLIMFAAVLFSGIAVWLPIYKKLWIKIVISCWAAIWFIILCAYCSSATSKDNFWAESTNIGTIENTCRSNVSTFDDKFNCMWDYAHDMSSAIDRYNQL